MITELLQRQEFELKPPVLLDIGASGDLPPLWKEISKYSIGIAFDGDERDFAYIEQKKKLFRDLIIVNKVVAETEGEIDFYLTASPHCSSTLKPDNENLANYAFADLFTIEKVIKVNAVKLSKVLSDNSIGYIDWYKTDTQGTDLRLIKSLPQAFIEKTIIYELEPGIIDAYIEEDMLSSVLQFFNEKKFIVLDANIKGSCRINQAYAKTMLGTDVYRNLHKLLPQTPDWCEISFFNSFKNPDLTIREYFLGWIFSTIKRQHGLALEIAVKGFEEFKDEILIRMSKHSANEINDIFINSSRVLKSTPKRRLINFLKKF